MGLHAMEVIKDLSSEKRVHGSPGEYRAAHKIRKYFESYGMKARFQKFSYVRGDVTYRSQNVVATLRGTTDRAIIIGAHYDSRPEGMGADDNASGVGVMLETAKRIAEEKRLPYTVRFVAFGAEESPASLEGSNVYVARMSDEQIKRSRAMINLDTLIVGDNLYVHAGANKKTWVRDRMLRIADEENLPLQIQRGLNPSYPAGFIPDGFSDYTAFNKAGIPIAALEATNWEIGDKDGYTQTRRHGSFWHTPRDYLPTIFDYFPRRPAARLHAFTKVTVELLESTR
jgi:Zn-dependent M28 family amino/carboxypeptidase